MADPTLPQVLQSNLDANAEIKQNQEQLQIAMRDFAVSNKTFAKTSIALNDFAKKQTSKLKINPFAKLKDKFDNSLIGQKRAQKKEEENLAKKIGLTREELLILKAEKELKESQQAAADQLKNSLQEYGIETNTFFNEAGELQARVADRDEKGRFQSARNIVNGIVGAMEGLSAAEVEERREQQRRDEESQTTMERLATGLEELGDNLLKGLKGLGEKGGMGLGIFAGLVAAPFIVLSEFFATLKKEFRVLKNLVKTKIFAPFQKLGSWLKGLGTKFKGLTSQKFPKISESFGKFTKAMKDTSNQFKTAGKEKILQPAKDALKSVRTYFTNLGANIKGAFGKGGRFEGVGKAIEKGKALGTRISDFFKNTFGQGGKLSSISKVFGEGFKPVAKFAGSVGRSLGRLFLPVTILFGIIDGVKGFMEGFSEEGIIGGLFGAVEGVLTGLVAIPLDLLKDGVSWIAEKMGFENFSKMLDSFSFAGLFDNIFNGLQDLRTAIADKVSDFWEGTKSFFGFGESEEEKAERLNERAERDALIEKNRIERRAEREGVSVEELRKKLEKEKAEELAAAQAAKEKMEARNNRRGMGAGGNKGAEINAQSAQAASAAPNVNVTTVSPTTVNAPSTNVSNQTNVTPTATRTRTRSIPQPVAYA